MDWLKRAKYLLFKFGSLTIVLIFPLGAFWDYLHPWAPAQPLLNQMYGRTPIMIGFSVKGPSYRCETTRTYLLVPSNLALPKVVTISQADEEPPRLSDSNVYFTVLLITWVSSGFVTWWHWLRADRKPPLVRDR